MSDEIRDFIARELDHIVFKKFAGENVMIPCPFHVESKPSCSIHMGNRVPPGTFRCFGCGMSGSWNVIAEALGLQKVTERVLSKQDVFAMLHSKLRSTELRSNEYVPPKGLLKWTGKWRGFDYSFLKQFNPAKWFDPLSEEYRILFFVKVGDEVLGHIAAKGNNSKAKPSYLFSQGNWAKKALFPYNHISKTDTIILVEGLRDALKLFYYDLPVLCIYGTNNWSPIKEGLICAKNVRNVILLMDGDKPGLKASRRIYREIKDSFNVRVIDLPILSKKIDPANMPSYMVKKLIKVTSNPKTYPKRIEFKIK